FTVAVFVTYRGRLLLMFHRRYRKWLPPGGHIRPGELPDEAAVREVQEETGLVVRLAGERALPVEVPRQLTRPEGIQLEVIEPGHEHIDLIYFAEPLQAGGVEPSLPELRPNSEVAAIGWFSLQELEKMDLTEEIRLWSRKALQTPHRRPSA
ncbi:MAG: NUDIX domain-containing protein, partial [Bacillota bacterium]